MTLELGSDQGQCSKMLSPNAISFNIQSDPCPYVSYKSESNKLIKYDKAAIGIEIKRERNLRVGYEIRSFKTAFKL